MQIRHLAMAMAAAVLAVGCVGVNSSAKKGALVLSFDDRNFAGWERAIPLFEKYGAHATFFVSGKIDDAAVATMRKLRAHGHTVGIHGLRHANAPKDGDAAAREKWFAADIEPQLAACRAAGLAVVNYAYPNCRRSDETDALLFAKGLSRIRGGSGLTPHDPKNEKAHLRKPLAPNDAAFVPGADIPKTRLMKGCIMGRNYHTNIDEYIACLRRAAARGEMFQIISHDIAPEPNGISMRTEWLEKLLATANELGLPVLSYDELPRSW